MGYFISAGSFRCIACVVIMLFDNAVAFGAKRNAPISVLLQYPLLASSPVHVHSILNQNCVSNFNNDGAEDIRYPNQVISCQ